MQKLEDSSLWQKSQEVAKYVYELVAQLPESEQITMQYKLRAKAFDTTSDIAEAVGAINEGDIEYAMGSARRSLFAIKNSYKYLHTQSIIDVDPDFMVLLNGLIDEVDNYIKETWDAIDQIQKEQKNESKR